MKLSVVSGEQAIRAFQRLGNEVDRQTGSHVILRRSVKTDWLLVDKRQMTFPGVYDEVMPALTLGFGCILIALGFIGYVATGQQSVTALIPSFFGAGLVVAGAVAFKDATMKHAMHGAAMLGLLGFLGSASGLLKLPALLSGAQLERPAAVASQSAMAVFCAIFVGLCVRSFIQVRRKREQAQT